MLSRIVSKVATTGASFIPSEGDHTAEALREVEQVWASHTAVVEVEQESDAATRLLKRRGTVTTAPGCLELHYADVNIIADELAAYGPEVHVLSPPELSAAVRDRLLRVAADHRDTPIDDDRESSHE